MLQPGIFQNVRKPALEAETLPPECYTSREFFDREVKSIFMKRWNFIGHDGQVAKPGDYMAFDLVGVPVIVARDRAGVIHAFANTCRHRGCRVISGTGNVRAFKCGYHGWVYNLDGRLTGAPQMEHSKGFDKADYGLFPVRLEKWGRFMFINFDKGAAPLKAQLGDLVDKLAPYNFDDMELVRRRELEVGCNWKIYYENVQEPYHTPHVHTTTLATKNEDEGATVMSGNSGLLFGEGGDNAPVKLEFGQNYSCRGASRSRRSRRWKVAPATARSGPIRFRPPRFPASARACGMSRSSRWVRTAASWCWAPASPKGQWSARISRRRSRAITSGWM
jgi:phenylpropionate dioxygenase-like ring-hydroxylating dioxygenase large terminal subunit